MEAFVIPFTILGLFALLVAAAPLIYALRGRMGGREDELEVWPVMRRFGIARQDAANSEPQLARAVRRCVMCASVEQCGRWLASGSRDGLDEFCPNASFVGELARDKPSLQ